MNIHGIYIKYQVLSDDDEYKWWLWLCYDCSDADYVIVYKRLSTIKTLTSETNLGVHGMDIQYDKYIWN